MKRILFSKRVICWQVLVLLSISSMLVRADLVTPPMSFEEFCVRHQSSFIIGREVGLLDYCVTGVLFLLVAITIYFAPKWKRFSPKKRIAVVIAYYVMVIFGMVMIVMGSEREEVARKKRWRDVWRSEYEKYLKEHDESESRARERRAEWYRKRWEEKRERRWEEKRWESEREKGL